MKNKNIAVKLNTLFRFNLLKILDKSRSADALLNKLMRNHLKVNKIDLNSVEQNFIRKLYKPKHL